VAIQIPWETHVMFTSYINREQAKRYWIAQFRFAMLAVAVDTAVWGAASLIPLYGVRGLLCKAALAATLATGLLFAVFRRDILEMVRKMLERRKR